MWLFITILGCLLLAIVNILDKFIVTKKVKPILFVFYSTVIALPLFLLIPFGVVFLKTSLDWSVTLLSGLTFGMGLWCMYKAFFENEISHVGPLLGAAISFFVFILSQIFLGEKITSFQIGGVFLLILGSLIISFEKSKKNNGLHIGILWAVLAGFLFAVSNVTTKYIYNHYDFYSGFVWTKGFTGIIALIILCFPRVREVIFKPTKKVSQNSSASKFWLIVSNKFLAVVGVLLVQYATAISSVTLVNALTGVQYACIILLVALLSKFKPKIFKETYSKLEIIQEICAVVLITIGVALLVNV